MRDRQCAIVTASGVAASVVLSMSASLAIAQASAPAEDASVRGHEVEQVIVTARRRAESMIDVPISIAAYTGEALEQKGIVRTEDLVAFVPSLNMAASGGGRATPAYGLRGINSLDPLGTDDQPVAIYINEVYVAHPTGTNMQLFDLESVQVLMGPQGTLFGRNSTAGAILFTAKKPTEYFESEVSATVGNFDRFDVAGVLNLPVTDTLAVRLAGKRTTSDGYTRDAVTGRDYGNENNVALRASVLWKPLSAVENLLTVDYTDVDERGTAFELHATTPTHALAQRYDLPRLIAEQEARGIRSVIHDFPNYARSKVWNLSNITTIELSDQITLKNIVGYRSLRNNTSIDIDGSSAPLLQSTQQEEGHSWSEELQVQADLLDDSLNLIGGVYYWADEIDFSNQSFIALPSVNSPRTAYTIGDNNSRSVFAQGVYKLPFLPRLSITAGGRYTWDERQSTYDNPRVMGTTPPTCRLTDRPGGPTSPCITVRKVDFTEPTYTFSLDYKLADDLLLYAAHRKGYRSGGFSVRGVLQREIQGFDPEMATDIEVGLKYDGAIGDVELSSNVALYRTKYTDIQRPTTGLIGDPPAVTTTVLNAGDATVDGFEWVGSIQPVTGVVLNGYWSYNDASYDRLRAGTATFTDVPFYNAKNSYGASVAYTPVDDSNGVGRITLNAGYGHLDSYRDSRNIPVSEPQGASGERDLVNTSIDWNNILGTKVSTTVYVRNVFDEEYVVGVGSFQSSLAFTYRQYGDPRTYGLTLKYNF